MTGSFCRVLLLLAAAGPVLAQNRYDAFTKKFANTPDQAKVVAAGHLGGAGTEWLVGGGFQPDGTVVVAGTSLGPTLELGGVKAAVLGTDTPAPEEYKPIPVVDKAGKPETNKDGTPKLKDPDWKHPHATAFVTHLTADLKTVKKLTRFPWKSGGVTGAAVDGKGDIYLAVAKTDGTLSTSLVKLAADGSKVLWSKEVKAGPNAPGVDLDGKGNVRFQSADLTTFDPAGKELAVAVVPGGLGGRVAVNPKDGTIAKGGETRNWNTGREPYRDPILNIHKPDGKLKYELYHWDGPLVGLDNLRLVSDSVVRAVRYDDDGNLLLYAWSDGGNSVMYREPFDIRTTAKEFKGLGMSAYGAGVLSCAYLIKIDTKTYKVSGGTLWLAFLKDKDKPNSIWVDTLDTAADGSVCVGGKSAWGLIETANKLNPGEPTGPYVAVFSKDCTSLRFCSVLANTAKAEVADNGQRWGVVKGAGKALFVGSASADAPADGGLSGKFAGGGTDGYLMLLDLGK